MMCALLLLLLYTVGYIISALRSFTLALSDDFFLYVTCNTEFPLVSPDYRVIQAAPSPI